MLKLASAIATLVFFAWSFPAHAEISIGTERTTLLERLTLAFGEPVASEAEPAASLVGSTFRKARYNNRTFDVGCEGDFCGVLLPVNAAARSTRYVEWAFTYLEGCYGVDAICDEIDKFVAAKLGIPLSVMKAMRAVYRATATEIIRQLRGNKSNWKMVVNNPPGGYVACNYRWTIKSVRGNASIVVFPDGSPGVGIWGAAVAQGDKGSWVEGAVYVRYVLKSRHERLVDSGKCQQLSGRFKINSNNVSGAVP